jgi:rhodanese-related sulfurtransferase
MTFNQGLVELDPQEVAKRLAAGEIRLIDVREPAEYEAARIEGAELYPLSAFDPSTLATSDKPIVFHCGVGGRSARAVEACLDSGIANNMHLRGGIRAWIAAGLPVIS